MIQTAICPVLIGREPQLSELEDALLAAQRGEGNVVLLSGEAGMGKSRLSTELRRRADKLGMTVLEGACSEAELSLPYLPFIEAVGNHLAEVDLAALRQRLGSAAVELAHLYPQLSDQPLTEQPDPTSARMRLFEAMLTLLRGLADEGGVLLILEDLHWSDASTRELLDYIARRIRNSRVLVLATYRSDELHRKHPLLPTLQAWRRSGLARGVELSPMDVSAVGRMVSAIFDQAEVGLEFREYMHGRSEGNPFVLEEMLKAALDRGDIYRDDNEWQRKAIKDLRLPATVRDTILLRVERLTPRLLDILRAASILGQVFHYDVLAEVAGAGDEELEEGLESFSREQLVVEDPGQGGRYRFRHALTQEAVYESLGAPRRQRLHARAAEVLAARLETPPVEVALHLLQANRAADAQPLLLRAADEALARWAYLDAAQLLATAAKHAPDPGEASLLHCRAADCHWHANQPVTAIALLEPGIAGLEAAGRLREAAGFRVLLARCRWQTGHSDEALQDYQAAAAELERHGPSPELAFAYVRMGGFYMTSLQPETSISYVDRAMEVADKVGAIEHRVLALNYKGCALGYLGKDEEGYALIEESHRLAMEHGLTFLAANAIFNMTVLLWPILRAGEAVELAQQLREPSGIWPEDPSDAHDCFSLMYLGRYAEAKALATRAYERAKLSEDPWGAETVELAVLWALVEEADFDAAATMVRDPLSSDDPQAAESMANLAMRLHLFRDEPEEALRIAEMVLEHRHWLGPDRWLQEITVQVLLLHGKNQEAADLVSELSESGIGRGPFLRMMEARVALAEADFEGSATLAGSAADEFTRASYLPDVINARLLRGQALAGMGSAAEASAEIQLAAAIAHKIGALARLRTVTRVADELGIDLGDEDTAPADQSIADAFQVAAATTPTGSEGGATGERYVTVMFADVRNYTELSARVAPAEVADRIATLHRWAQQEVERERGVVDKFAGDAVMATFNVSGAEVDHTLHALRAASAIQGKAALHDTPVGVGIAVGPAVVGRLSAGANLSVLGETTNLAARLQAAATGGEILMSAEAYRRVAEALADRGMVAEATQLSLKGFERPVDAWRVTPVRARTAPG